MVYGQTEVTKDLYEAQDVIGASIIHNAEDVTLHNVKSAKPRVTWIQDGVAHELTCDFIAGCDGFHGVSRPSIPAEMCATNLKRFILSVGWVCCPGRHPSNMN